MESADVPAPAVVRDGYMVNPMGYLVPVASIRPDVLLEDQVVRTLCAQALGMQNLLLEFRTGAFCDVDQFLALLSEKYSARPRSASNTMLVSFDGLLKVEVSTGNFLTLGAALAPAKSLIDECLEEWSQGANSNLQAIVSDAFAIGEGGKLRVDRILALRRVEINDPKWQRAMQAISDAVQVTHSKRYVRFHTRASADAPWAQISLDMARIKA